MLPIDALTRRCRSVAWNARVQGVSLPEIRSGPEVRRCLSIRKYRCHQHPLMDRQAGDPCT